MLNFEQIIEKRSITLIIEKEKERGIWYSGTHISQMSEISFAAVVFILSVWGDELSLLDTVTKGWGWGVEVRACVQMKLKNIRAFVLLSPLYSRISDGWYLVNQDAVHLIFRNQVVYDSVTCKYQKRGDMKRRNQKTNPQKEKKKKISQRTNMSARASANCITCFATWGCTCPCQRTCIIHLGLKLASAYETYWGIEYATTVCRNGNVLPSWLHMWMCVGKWMYVCPWNSSWLNSA
jgi:hypothetical protein